MKIKILTKKEMITGICCFIVSAMIGSFLFEDQICEVMMTADRTSIISYLWEINLCAYTHIFAVFGFMVFIVNFVRCHHTVEIWSIQKKIRRNFK